MTSKLIRYSGW